MLEGKAKEQQKWLPQILILRPKLQESISTHVVCIFQLLITDVFRLEFVVYRLP